MSEHPTTMLRPTAYFWSRFQFFSQVTLLALVGVSVVLIFSLHEGWPGFLGGFGAVSSQVGNIAGIVQTTRELRLGYTTLPWLAFEAELRDPANGEVLRVAHSREKPFDTLAQARQFAADFRSTTPGAAHAAPSEPDGWALRQTTVETVDARRGRFIGFLQFAGLCVASAVIIGGLIAFIVWAARAAPVAAGAVGILAGIVIISIVFAFPTVIGNARSKRRAAALSAAMPNALLIPVRVTVELFAEIEPPRNIGAYSSLVLAADEGGLSLWSGGRVLTRVFSAARADVGPISTADAHDTRGRAAPAIKVSLSTDPASHLLLFPRKPGAGSLWPADAALTQSRVSELVGALS